MGPAGGEASRARLTFCLKPQGASGFSAMPNGGLFNVCAFNSNCALH
jgi:hypothetical protein